jgi:HSP20 family protein
MAQALATQKTQGGSMPARRENPLERLRQDFDTVFGRMLGGMLTPFDQDFETLRIWDFDVTENDKEIVVRAEMPGFEQNELDVQINNDVLTIKAEKEQKGNGKEEYRSFFRRVTLPSGINPEKVQANYHNGVLELHIPRVEGSQPKRIEVQGDQATTGQQGQQAAPNKAGATATEKAKK